MKQLILVSILSVASATSASAFPNAAMVRRAENTFHKHELKAPIAARETGCQDFSGTWKGTCNIAGQDFPDTTKIAQSGCYALATDDTLVFIGGVHSESESEIVPADATHAYGVTSTSSSSADWSADGKALGLRVGALGRILGAGDFYDDVMRGDMRLLAGRLAINLTGSAFAIHCVYDKQ